MNDTDIAQSEPVGYKIAWLDDTGQFRTLQEYASYSEAEEAYDSFDESGDYDNTLLEIIPIY